MSARIDILHGDCREVLRTLPTGIFDCCVTSPPYFGLRNYGVSGQIGLEATPAAFVAELVDVFREVRRVLRDDGTLWLNLGDSYANDSKWGGQTSGKHVRANHGDTGIGRRRQNTGLKSKDLIGVPWAVAFALREDGWYLRKDIIWSKPNAMPESVRDRPTSAHEYIFLLSKSERYYYDADAIREAEAVPNWDDGSRVFGGVNKHGANIAHGDRTTGRLATARKRGTPPRHAQYSSSDQSGLDDVARGDGRNKRSVWTIATKPFAEAHFATFPPDLIEPCIKAGCRPVIGRVLDPFGGAGTTGLVAARLQRSATLIELNPAYAEMARSRISGDAPLFGEIHEGDAA